MNLEPHYQALRSYFRSVDDHRGKALAEQLTACLNEAISQQKTVLTSLPDWDSALRLIVEALPAQPAALSLPWQAYHAAQWEHEDEWHTGATIEAVLATVPRSYRVDVLT